MSATGVGGASAALPVDPRMRARRISVRRNEGRRRLSRLLRLLILVAVIGLGAFATRTPLLDVDHLDIGGNVHTPAAAVAAASGMVAGDPMTDLDLGAARRSIATLPWIESVTIARRWPGTVEIRVRERQPAAVVPAGQGGWVVTDATGRLLALADTPPPELVQLADVAPAGAPGGQLPDADHDALMVATHVPAELVGRVVAVAPVKGGELELRLADGARVAFGATDELEAKFVAVTTVLDQVDEHCLAVLDVRVPSAPVLTRTPGCA